MYAIFQFIYQIVVALIVLIVLIIVMNLFRYIVIDDLSVREVLSHPVEYASRGMEETWNYLKGMFEFVKNQFQGIIG